MIWSLPTHSAEGDRFGEKWFRIAFAVMPTPAL
jgi:hypothetical protein